MNGGEISYVATIDTKQLKSQLKDGEKSLLGFNDVAEKAGETLDNMIDGDILKNLKSMGIEVGKTGAELKKALKDADEFVSGMESGLKIVIAEHAKLLSEINKMPEGNARNQLLEEYRNEAVEIEKVSNQITQYKEFLSNVKDESKSLTVKLKEVTDEMKVLYDRGEQNSVRYQELKEKAVEYKEALSVVNNEIKIASGPQGFNGLINLLTFSAGAFSTVQGAVGLFGTESEDLNKIMLRVQSSLALVIGLQEIQKQLSKEGAFNITVLTRIKEIWAATNLKVATTLGITTGASQALMAGLTLGLSVAVIAIIALFQKWQTESDKIAEKNKQLTSSLSDSVAEPLFQYKRLQMQWNSLGEDLNKKKKFIDDNKDSFNKLGVEVSNVSEAEKILGSQSDTFIEMMMLRAEAAANAQMAMESFKKSLELRGEANEKLKNPTIGQNISAWWQMAIMGKSTDEYIAGAYQESDAEKQKALDFTKSQVESMQKSNDLFKKMGLKKPTKENKPKNTNEKADEFLPEGSVAEIRKRLSQIDEALSKATGTEQISQLKTNRIKTAIELAKAEKLIQIQSITEQVNESKNLWEQYYNAVNSIGKEKADKLFSDLLKKDKTQFDSLVRQRDELVAKGNLSDEERTVLGVLNNDIDKMLGQKSQLDQFKEKTEKTLSNLATISEKIAYLDSLKNSETNTQTSLGIGAYLTDERDKLRNQQNKEYQEFLKSTEDFNKKLTDIQKIYAEQRKLIYNDEKLSEKDKQNALISSDKAENSAISDALANSLLNDPLFTQNFDKIGEFAFAQFDRIKAALLKKLEEARNAGLDENSDVVQRIIERLKRLDEAASRNPFSELINDWKKFIDSLKDGESDLQGIASKVAAGASMVNKSISVGLGIAQDLGLQFDESTQEVINDVQTTLAGVGDLAAGIASKNPMQIIKGIAGIVKGMAGLFNGDRKKEKQIKEWADQVKNLKVQYQELERAIEKALGSDKYTAQQNVIANLEKQKILLQQMIQKEKDKKKTDNGKIDDWKQQISDLNAQIDDLKKSIVDDILQIDVKGLADKIGDALIEGFGRGEDALDSLNKTADDVFRQMVKNALKLQLEKQMQPIIDEMLRAMGYSVDSSGKPSGSFDGLTQEERDALKAKIIAATGDYQKAMEQYADLFGPDAANSPNGLKGDIKGITEKTAGALESQINAIRIYQVEALNISKRNQQIFLDALKYQAEIAYNTRPLFQIQKDIAELNSKVKKPLAGLDN